MKKDIIMVPFHDYKKWISEGFRTRDAHLFEHFKQNEQVNKILVVNRPVSLIEMIFKRKNWKTRAGNVIWKKRYCELREIETNVYCIDFFLTDLFKVVIQRKKWWYTAFNYEKIQKAIKEAVNILNMNNKTLFLENPMAVGIIGKLSEDKFVFDAIDNWLYHPQMKKNYDLIKKNYEFIEQKADVIFTVSKELRELFLKNKNVYWIPNGVDISRFDKAITKDKREYPTIGYIGKIQERVDFNLVEEILRTFNKNQVLFIGPVYSQTDTISKLTKKYSNIRFLGDIHYEKLPEKMQDIDIAIIPHKIDKFTNSMNPLKIYEYIAAGKQTVTTNVAGIQDVSDYVYIANDNNEFIELLKKAIEEYKSKEDLSENVRKNINKNYLWENITEIMLRRI